MNSPSARRYVACLAIYSLTISSAHAHGIAGNRLFPGTFTFDDPAVADELSGPVVSNQTHPLPGAGSVRDTSVEASISRLLLPDLAIGVDSDWTEHETPDGTTQRGIGATHLSLKGQLYRNDPHETLLAASVSWGIGGIGNPNLHAHAYNTVEPGVFFGRGLGDLSERYSWLRPFAIAGGQVVDVPLSRQSRPRSGAVPVDNPVILHTGFALEYSTLYLTDRFNGETPSEEPVKQFVPLVEFEFDSPLNGGYGTATSVTMNPGLAYVGETFQVSAEAIVPLNRSGGSPGFRLGVLFFLDDLFPGFFGKPLFH
jgi:hypothetical protein